MTTTNTITASVSNYKGTPRKMRLLADFVRGKKAKKALAELAFLNKRHATGLSQVIAAAVANAKENAGTDASDWHISDIQVQEGKAMKRQRPASRGRAMVFRRRLSHIAVELSAKKETK